MKSHYLRIYVICISVVLLLLMVYTMKKTTKQNEKIQSLEQKIKSLEREKIKMLLHDEFNTK
jgi:uncharacterized membrane protein YvbJ